MLIALNLMFFSSAQAQTVNNDTTFLYDNWPTIVPSNADVGKKFKDGQINPNYVPIGSVWNKRLLTYFFQNHTNDISVLAQRDAIRKAFDLWAEQTGMAFIEVCNASNADITILWAVGAHGDGGDFDGPGWELAHAFWPPPLGNPLSGDIHFDDDEDWTDQIRLTTGQPTSDCMVSYAYG